MEKKPDYDDDDDEDERKRANAAGNKDPGFMPKQLKQWLNAGEFPKAHKFASGKLSRGSKTSMFYAVITAYCNIKMGKTQECIEGLQDYKAQKPQDTETAKYLVAIYNKLNRYSEATQVLEYILEMYPGHKELSEGLFCSYVREGKLLKQQNQALTLYKANQEDLHAQWAVESMYLISLNLKFETKVLDIAYLLMLKLMKEPKFVFDKKFVLLHVKILSKQGKFKDAVDFIDRQSEFFPDKLERQQMEASLYLQANNQMVMAINVFFNILRLNSHINQYTDMWDQYQKCITVICDDFLPRRKKYELKGNIDQLLLKAETKGVNFDPITIEAEPEEVLFNLIISIQNLRKNIAVDGSSKRVMTIANDMKRQSYIADLEYKFVLALNYPTYQVSENSPYFELMVQYIERFYDRFDVISDIRKYLSLFGPEEAAALKAFDRKRLEEFEAEFDPESDEPPNLKLIRWRMVHFKINKILGSFKFLENAEKFKLVNSIMQTYLWAHGNSENLTEIDKNNLDDIIIVASELLYEIKIYEWCVLNPVNFMLISTLELAINRSPSNISLRIWLMKIIGKLGLTNRFTGVASHISTHIKQGFVDKSGDDNFERFGALKYSHYQTFGTERELQATCERYEKYYIETITQNKKDMVQGFRDREFGNLNDLLAKNEKLESSFFQTVVKMSRMHLEIMRSCTTASNVQKNLNKNSQFLNQLADDDKIPVMSKINVDIRKFDMIKLGVSREKLKDDESVESLYDQKAAKKKKERDAERDKNLFNGNVRVFGYKHPKSMKFMALLFRCLKNCMEGKHEQLNLDMNQFLLLKNELSLVFLRNQDNIVATVKTAIKLYATQEEMNRKDLEQQELQVLEKILKTQADYANANSTLPDHQQGIGGFGKVTEPGSYEKIIAKLLEYNEKVNDGKEISVVEYLKKIDMDSKFAKTYEMQRHIKRAFFEEFKIHSLNYVLLLFESVMRIITTVNRDKEEEDGGPGLKRNEKMQYYSKNYRRFIENRQKKIDKFIVNCIGWNHINRCIEVIDMSLRDLLYKIVPTKVVIRELKTSSGKVLNKDSEYTLVERKRYVTVGKKTHVDYIFELDLKEDTAKVSAKEEEKRAEEEKKRQNVFYLNFEDFSMVKLRSTVFMIYFPITFTISIINIWLKILPNPSQPKSETEEYTKEEVEGINAAKHGIRDFVHSLTNHLKSLNEYLNGIIKQKPLQANYNLIRTNDDFKAFKDVFLKTKHTGMTTVQIEEFFLQNYEKIEKNWGDSVEQIAKTIIIKVNDIQMELFKKL